MRLKRIIATLASILIVGMVGSTVYSETTSGRWTSTSIPEVGDTGTGWGTNMRAWMLSVDDTFSSSLIGESDLKAVDTPADEECFTYESTTGDFEWQDCATGGSGAQNAFKTIDVTGTDAVADSSVDTLILAGGSGVTVTGTDPDTVTITADHDAITNFAANEHYTQANITAVGTIASGVWQGTDIADADVANDITIDLATLATTVTITDNENDSETNAVVFLPGGDLDGGNLALESDGTFNYNPSTGTVTATVFVGAITGEVTGNAATATALAANGGNCSAGEIPLGVDASGAVESCYQPAEADITDLAHTATGITDDLIVEADLAADNSAVDDDILVFDDTGNDFAWKTPTELSLATAGGAFHDGFSDFAGGEHFTEASIEVMNITATGGTNGYVVSSDGANGLEWAAAGSGDVTGVGDCTDGACLDGTSDGGTNIALYDGDSNKVTISSGNLAGDITMVLPTDDGDASEFLQTNGSGTLTWAVPGGSGDVTGVGDCADGACLDGTSDGGETIALYDGDSHKGTIDLADASGDVTITLQAVTGTVYVSGGTDVADADVADNITIDLAATATALAADPANCAAGSVPLGVTAAGVAEGCYDGATQAELDAYTGGANIVTVGTIATGTWEGTTVAVDQGGTGATSLADGFVLLGSGTGAVTALDLTTDSAFLVGDGTTDPVAETGATARTSMGVGTGDSPQLTGIEVGHANDTTLTRKSAGVLQVQTNELYVQGGTDVALADGGTGAGTAVAARAVLEAPAPMNSVVIAGSSLTVDTYRLTKEQVAITIIDIHCITDTGTVIIELMEESGTGTGGATVDAPITCDSDGAADDGTLANGTIDAADWLSARIGTEASSPTNVAITWYYTVD